MRGFFSETAALHAGRSISASLGELGLGSPGGLEGHFMWPGYHGSKMRYVDDFGKQDSVTRSDTYRSLAKKYALEAMSQDQPARQSPGRQNSDYLLEYPAGMLGGRPVSASWDPW